MAVKIVNSRKVEKLLDHTDLQQGRFYLCRVAPDDRYIGKLLFTSVKSDHQFGVWIDLAGIYSGWTSLYNQFSFIEVDVTIAIE
jgi:hypothetical protein